MEWSDEGIVLAARPHGEGHAVAEILTPNQGRWAGLVFGGSGRRKTPLLQPGNLVRAQWRGRLSESLGTFTIEMITPHAAELMMARLSLQALSAICAIANTCLPEREAHSAIYQGMKVCLNNLEEREIWPALMARWELGLLSDMGFGLTLDRCAATGARDNLVYVSPKSACAVSAQAGEPYQDKLLPLPSFLGGEGGAISTQNALDGLKTTGYFIETRILHLSNKQLPEARLRIIDLLQEK